MARRKRYPMTKIGRKKFWLWIGVTLPHFKLRSSLKKQKIQKIVVHNTPDSVFLFFWKKFEKIGFYKFWSIFDKSQKSSFPELHCADVDETRCDCTLPQYLFNHTIQFILERDTYMHFFGFSDFRWLDNFAFMFNFLL